MDSCASEPDILGKEQGQLERLMYISTFNMPSCTTSFVSMAGIG